MSPRSRLESFRKQQAKLSGADASAPGAPLESPRRLEAFRAAQARASAPSSGADSSTGFRINLPSAGGGVSEPAIPSLGLAGMGGSGACANPNDPDYRPLSSRRLKKEVLRAETASVDGSNSAGHITLRDGSGTPRSVRVVQHEEFENFNMVSCKWVYSLDSKSYQIELRHGRRSVRTHNNGTPPHPSTR